MIQASLNEMMQASLNEMMPVYHKLFNNILNRGSMPLMWCSGLITPIFKSGGRNDPTNYREICVSSCLGKLFCSINFKPKSYGTCPLVEHTSQFSNRLFTKQPNGRPRKKLYLSGNSNFFNWELHFVTRTFKRKSCSCFV